jgi:hypothetical protein
MGYIHGAETMRVKHHLDPDSLLSAIFEVAATDPSVGLVVRPRVAAAFD